MLLALASAMSIGLSPPNADPENLTLSSDAHPMFDAGKLIGCEVSFDVLRRNTSHDNNPVELAGALAVLQWRGKEPLLVLRLGLTTADGSHVAPGSSGLTFENTTNAGDLIADQGTTPGVSSELKPSGESR